MNDIATKLRFLLRDWDGKNRFHSFEVTAPLIDKAAQAIADLTAQLSDAKKMLDATAAGLADAIKRNADLTAENERLRGVFEEILSRRQYIITAYEQNGPQWTTHSGSEVESTADVVAAAKMDVDYLKAALQERKP